MNTINRRHLTVKWMCRLICELEDSDKTEQKTITGLYLKQFTKDNTDQAAWLHSVYFTHENMIMNEVCYQKRIFLQIYKQWRPICTSIARDIFCFNKFDSIQWVKEQKMTVLIRLNSCPAETEYTLLFQTVRSRSVGFFRSQLIWICTDCH